MRYHLFLVSAIVLTCCVWADGVILESTPTRNTAEPTGALEDSGWQYQGQFGSFLGTPISPWHFITAKHIGGAAGTNTFNYGGVFYDTTAFVDDPDSDLRIWTIGVAEAFPTYAPLYTDTDELGKSLVVFGRGTQRGAELHLDSPPRPGESTLRGWRWGVSDGVQSWGENVVSAVSGDHIQFSFSADGVANESALTGGDSGGGLFIKDPDDGLWKLAGVNFGVSGPWRLDEIGDGDEFDDDDRINASVFDAGDLYLVTDPNPDGVTGNPDTLMFIPDDVSDIPGSSASTRVSTHLAFINSVIPEPSTTAWIAMAAVSLLRRRRR